MIEWQWRKRLVATLLSIGGWWLSAHSATHGFAVALLTGIPLLGLMEILLHLIIDWDKVSFRFALALDQRLNFLCKLIWVDLLFWA